MKSKNDQSQKFKEFSNSEIVSQSRHKFLMGLKNVYNNLLKNNTIST